MATTETPPELDIKEIFLRGPSLNRRTVSDGKTKLKLRRHSTAQITIDIFLPPMAHDVECRARVQAGTTIRAWRLLGVLRVVRVVICGTAAEELMRRDGNGLASPQRWCVEDATKHFAPTLQELYFVYSA